MQGVDIAQARSQRLRSIPVPGFTSSRTWANHLTYLDLFTTLDPVAPRAGTSLPSTEKQNVRTSGRTDTPYHGVLGPDCGHHIVSFNKTKTKLESQ